MISATRCSVNNRRLLVTVINEVANQRQVHVHHRYRQGWLYGQVLRVRSFLRAVSSARFLLRSLVLPAFAVQRSVKHTIASENIAADRSGNLASDVPMPKLLNTMGLDDSKCLHACLRLGSARVVQHCVGTAAVTML
jgi:hypothetical protein